MLQNQFNGGVARYTAKLVFSEYWVVLSLQLNLCEFRVLPTQGNFFFSEWRNSRLWCDSRVILCNQKSVFTQFPTTSVIVGIQAWTLVIKRETSLSYSFCSIFLQNMAKFLLQDTASFAWLFKQKELREFFGIENV